MVVSRRVVGVCAECVQVGGRGGEADAGPHRSGAVGPKSYKGVRSVERRARA